MSRKRASPAAQTTPPRAAPAARVNAGDDDDDFLTLCVTPQAPGDKRFEKGFKIACEPTRYPPDSAFGTAGHETGNFITTMSVTPKFNRKSGPDTFNNNQAVHATCAPAYLAMKCGLPPLALNTILWCLLPFASA